MKYGELHQKTSFKQIEDCWVQSGYSRLKKNRIFKARLVAQFFAQIPGINFMDNFSPVIYKTTFRIILILWATYNWEAEVIDIETAFLYSDLEGVIYSYEHTKGL